MMKRLLVGVVAALFFAIEAAGAFHHHANSTEASSCAVCVAVDQVRAAPTAAPAPALTISLVAVLPEAPASAAVAASSAVPARGPPSVA